MPGRFEAKKQKHPLRKPALWVLCAILALAVLAGAVWALTHEGPSMPSAELEPTAAEASAPAEAPAPPPTRDLAPEIIGPSDAPGEPDAAGESAPAEAPAVQSLTLMAVGDNLIHNTVYWSAQLPDGSYDFTPFYQDIAPVAAAYDLACINQETILVHDPALYDNYPRFGSPEAVGDAVAAAGFNIVTHATNHCYDKGDTGILDSVSFWRTRHPDVTMLGIHDTEADAQTLRVVEKNGLRVALLNYTYGLNYELPANRWMVDILDRDKVTADVRSARQQADFVVVFVHWGEEGSFTPDQTQRDWAALFASLNVDAVIGAHPHVLQPLESIARADGRQMPVFYSLGNFLSHQMSAEQMLGGLASLRLVKDETGTRVEDAELLPTVNFLSHSETGPLWSYRPMLLRDYTDEMAAQHRFPETTVDYLWSLYDQITGQSAPTT